MNLFRPNPFCLFLLVTGLLSLSSSLLAQIAQPSRFEEERKYSDRNYNMVSLKEEGIALIHDNEKYEDGKKIWDLTLLDSSLTKTWSGTLRLNSRLQFIGYEYLPGNLYLLFRNGELNSNDLHLVHHQLATHEIDTYEIKHQVDFRITHFSMAGPNAVFGGYIVREPAVFLYSLHDNQLKVVPGFFLHDTELLDLRVNHNTTFNVLMTERGTTKDQKKLIVRTYDESGTMLMDDIIAIDPDKNLISGMTSSLLKDEMIVVGTYGFGLSRQTSGFFSVMVDPFSEQPVRYTDLTQFNHLLDYMGQKRATKVKQNGEQQRQKGKAPNFKSNVALIRVQETQKGFLLLAEVYNSSSGSTHSSYWNTSPYGFGNGYSPYGPYANYSNRYYNTPYSTNPIQNTEVKMVEGVVVLFGENGLPDWDESFEFDNMKYPALEQISDFTETGKGIVMAYKKESKIFSKNVTIHDSVIKMDTTDIRLPGESDKIRNESEGDGGMRHWYKNYFYTWGYQSIKDPSKKMDDPNRHVFYINKLGVE